MYLYELAMELGEHSNALAERARQAGVADAGPSSSLTPAQVAILRGAPQAPPAGAGPAWIPAPPPPGTATAGTGPAPLPPGLPASPGGDNRQRLVIGAVIVAVVVAGLALFLVATPDTAARRRDLAARNAVVEAQTKIEARAYKAKVTKQLQELDRLRKAEEAREAERQREREALRAANRTVPVAPAPQVVDAAAFCQGNIELAGFELRMAADALEQKWDVLAQTVAENEGRWRTGADRMVAATSGQLQQDVELYRSSYLDLMEGIRTASSTTEVQQAFLDLPYREVFRAAGHINQAAFDTCG